MKTLLTTLLVALFFLAGTGVTIATSAEKAPLLPESLAARAEMAASQKTITIFFKEDDPKKATINLNDSSSEYAQKGWTVFSIIPFMENGDFEGFFVTYQKNLILE